MSGLSLLISFMEVLIQGCGGVWLGFYFLNFPSIWYGTRSTEKSLNGHSSDVHVFWMNLILNSMLRLWSVCRFKTPPCRQYKSATVMMKRVVLPAMCNLSAAV